MDISRQWSKCLQVQRNWCREFCRRGGERGPGANSFVTGKIGQAVRWRHDVGQMQSNYVCWAAKYKKYRRIQIQILGGHFITHLLKMTLRLEGCNPGDWRSQFFIISLEVMWCWCLCWWFDWICNRKNNSLVPASLFSSRRNFLFIFLFENVTIYEKSTVGTEGIFLWSVESRPT